MSLSLKCLHQADFPSFSDFGIVFSSCSDSVVFVCVWFYRNKNMFKCKNVIVNILVCPKSLSFCPVDLHYVPGLCSLGRERELVEQMETKSRLGKPLQNICVMVYNGYVLFVVGVEISFFFTLS